MADSDINNNTGDVKVANGRGDYGGHDTSGRNGSGQNKDGQRENNKHRPRTILIRYGMMGMVGQFRHSERDIPKTNSHVVVNTDRGLEIGEVISPYCHHRGNFDQSWEEIDEYCGNAGSQYPFSRQGRIVRMASDQDLAEQRHLEKSVERETAFCMELIKEHGLPMRLIATEHLFGGDRIIYYFMSDGRVDFRQLVKELAHEYQTRIELRQVGARDEARLLADLETCGRECCCKNFLKVLQPVNMRMAKVQKATLDPSKISGRCGRLKCCLRYEDECYQELQKKLPRNNTCVLIEAGAGTVIGSQILTQLVKVRLLSNGAVVAVNVDEILQRDYKVPEGSDGSDDGQAQAVRKKGKPDSSGSVVGPDQRKRGGRDGEKGSEKSKEVAGEVKPGVADGSSEGIDKDGDGTRHKKKRRRRRRKKSKKNDG